MPILSLLNNKLSKPNLFHCVDEFQQMDLLAKCFEHTHPLHHLSCQTTLEKHVHDDSVLLLGNWRELPWMQEQGDLMVEICIRMIEITIEIDFFFTNVMLLWNTLDSTIMSVISTCGIAGSSGVTVFNQVPIRQTAKFWGHFPWIMQPQDTSHPTDSPAPFKVLDLPFAWKHPYKNNKKL